MSGCLNLLEVQISAELIYIIVDTYYLSNAFQNNFRAY